MINSRPVGTKERFYIHDAYKVRPNNAHFDDTPFKDEWQDEVYKYAREIFDVSTLRGTVVDVGCGSGYKLVKYFGDVKTIGVDVDPSISYVRNLYPDREWQQSNWSVVPAMGPSLVICSDVIEHLPNPDQLLEYIQGMDAEAIIFSTPERDTLGLGTEDGPPRNKHHVREWGFNQFNAYLSDFFYVVEHFTDGSQIVLCVPETK